MTPEQFWEGDPDYFWAYLEADNMRYKAQLEYDNVVAHLQGLYEVKALAQVLQFSKSPKKIYPDKPINLKLGISEAEDKLQQFEEYEIRRKAQMRALAQQFAKKKHKDYN